MTSNREPLVSIVSPVHNVERYVRECIESVLSQTYENWEYIIVDNCSTDRTLEIAAEYRIRDPRIRIQENRSFLRVIENYNTALRHISAESRYCKVLAGDDWLYPECIERMVRLAEQYPRVVIVGAYGGRGTAIAWTGLPYSVTVVPGREICRSFLLGAPYVFGTPSSVLYRSEIVRSRNTFYNELNIHADTEACCEFLEHSDFGFVHQILTHSRVREDSMMSFMESFNTYAPWGLYLLDKYGPKYLGKEELERSIRKKLACYYQYLGKQVFRRRGVEFWNFHKDKLAKVGRPLSGSRLASSAIAYGLDIVLNPKRALEELARRLGLVSSS
jgi:glycosyltransferase involved in cell wall biosynthesis